MAYDITKFVGSTDINVLKQMTARTQEYFNYDDNDPLIKKSSMIIYEDLEVLEGSAWTNQKIADTCNQYKQKCSDYEGVEVEAVEPMGINSALPVCAPERSDVIAQKQLKVVLYKWAISEIKYGYTEGEKVWTEVTGLPSSIETGSSTDGSTTTTISRKTMLIDQIREFVKKSILANNLSVGQYTLYPSPSLKFELETLGIVKNCCTLDSLTKDYTQVTSNIFGFRNIIEIPAGACPSDLAMALYYTPYQWLKVFCNEKPYTDRNSGVNTIKRNEWAIKGMQTIGFKSIKPDISAFFVKTTSLATKSLADEPQNDVQDITINVEAENAKKELEATKKKLAKAEAEAKKATKEAEKAKAETEKAKVGKDGEGNE